MSKQRRNVVVNLIAFIFLLGASVVFSRDGNTLNDGQIMPIFMPAGYAFSIWSLIYLLLGIWIIKGVNPSENEQKMYKNVGYWLAAALVFSALTIIVPLEWTVGMILLALVTALVAYQKVDKSASNRIYRIPYSLLVGWLSVATIVNISLVLKSKGITEIFGIGEVGWAIIMLAVGAILAIFFSVSKDDNLYPLVFVWGYIAIAVRNAEIPSIVRMALIASGLLIVLVTYNLVSQFFEREKD